MHPDFWTAVQVHRNVMVVTGAGISASAGIPTYRTPGQSTWTDARLHDISRSNRYGNHLPELWEHWWSILDAARAAQPTPAHHALVEWGQRVEAAGGEWTLVTQNIDGLHTRAGSDPLEFHGTLLHSRCLRCDRTFPTPERGTTHEPPACPECGRRRTRPDVVLFGERIDRNLRDTASRALRRADLLVMIGTSGNVWPVAGWPAETRGATALIDPEPWPSITFDHHWAAGANEVLAGA